MFEISDEALAVLERAYEAAARFDPEAKVRIYRRGDRIETGFAHAPSPGDRVLERGGFSFFVEGGIAGTLDVSAEHDHLIVREGTQRREEG
ncbi:MAG: hypothetical protein ACRDIF_03575 [Actinomycetota bacterium]